MTRYLLTAMFVCAGVLIEGAALAQPPAPPSGPACLQQINMHDFQTVPGNRSLVVIDRARIRYRVNFVTPCYNLQHHLRIGFKTFGTSALSCVAKGDKLLMRDVVGPNQCLIKSVEYQTPALDRQDAQAAAAPPH